PCLLLAPVNCRNRGGRNYTRCVCLRPQQDDLLTEYAANRVARASFLWFISLALPGLPDDGVSRIRRRDSHLWYGSYGGDRVSILLFSGASVVEAEEVSRYKRKGAGPAIQ